MVFYLIIFIMRYILIFLFVVPKVHYYFGIASLVLFALALVLYLIVSNTDPGFIVKAD